MSATRQGLLQAICEQPDDDNLRLIFADYLEDHGEVEYGQFIRKQIELAKVPEYDPLWVRTWFEDRAAITGEGFERYACPIPGVLSWDHGPFQRGFSVRYTFQQIDQFLTVAPDLFAGTPIQSVKLYANFALGPPDLSPLTASPYLGRLRELIVSLARLPATEIQRLQDSPHVANLTALDFEFAGIVPDAVESLFRPPLLAQLTRLRLHSNDIPWDTLTSAIEQAGGPYRLRKLTLSQTTTAATRTHTLFAAPLLRGVVELDLSTYQLGAPGFAALASSGISSLESLDLSSTAPGVPGIQALAGSAALSGLRRLILAKNRLGPVAIRHLAGSPHLANLRILDLSHNPIGDKGVAALIEAPFFPNLMQLELSDCEIGDTGAQALLNAPEPTTLLRLTVAGGSPRVRVSEGLLKKLQERFGRKENKK
jgi:uncharacterized protein (TIGR02996 family)